VCACHGASYTGCQKSHRPKKKKKNLMMIYGGCNIGKVYKFSTFIYKSSEFFKKYQKYENTKDYIQKYKGENVQCTPRIDCLV
jgi:hypothetical protein